jgi:CDP-diglyceride synthetase
VEKKNLLFLISAVIINVEMIFFGIEILVEFIKCKKNPENITDRCWDSHMKTCIENEKSADKVYVYNRITKTDISRKGLHMIAPSVIILFYVIGILLDSAGILSNWDMDVIGLLNWTIITIGIAFVLMFAVGDTFRLLDRYQYLPAWAHKWYGGALNQNEWETFMGTIPIIISLVPFMFTDFPVFLSTVLIGTVADALASLVGKGIGRIKLKFSKHDNKTVEGNLAGAIVTFSIVFIVMAVFNTNLVKTAIMSVVAMIIFMLVDRYAKNISDNLLNPILCGVGLILLNYLI